MSIDWSTAPEGATHWEPRSDEYREAWMKNVADKWFFWGSRRKAWIEDPGISAEREATFEAKPQDPWNGRGLPPVGTVCRLSGPTKTLVPLHPELAGCEVKIYAHFESDRGIKMAAYVSDDHMIGGCGVEDLFVRMPPPEQIAAQEREKAIEEMCFAEETLTVKQAKALFDAGYRRQDEAMKRNADRYLWLRNPDQDVSLVLDKVSGEVPADEFGCGGYRTYEYRSGDELDAAIDAAMERTP